MAEECESDRDLSDAWADVRQAETKGDVDRGGRATKQARGKGAEVPDFWADLPLLSRRGPGALAGEQIGSSGRDISPRPRRRTVSRVEQRRVRSTRCMVRWYISYLRRSAIHGAPPGLRGPSAGRGRPWTDVLLCSIAPTALTATFGLSSAHDAPARPGSPCACGACPIHRTAPAADRTAGVPSLSLLHGSTPGISLCPPS